MTPREHRPARILLALGLAGLSYAVLSSAPIPALPVIRADLHTGETGTAWILTAYLLASAVATVVIGRMGDIYGKRRMLRVMLLVLVAGALVGAVAHTLALLIAARVIQGTGAAVFPLAFGIVRDEFPADRVPGGLGLMSATLAIGGGLGLVGAGPIVEQLGWHWLFWIPLATSLVACYLTARFVPESPIRVPGRINWPAALLMISWISLILVAISQTTTWGWGSAKTIGLIAAGVALAVAWIALELRSSEPLVDMRLMRVRGVWTTNASSLLLGVGMYASFFLFPQFAELPKLTKFGFGVSVVTAGLYLLPMTALMAVAGGAYGRVSERLGARRALILGTLLTGCSFLQFRLAHGHPLDMVLSAAILGIGLGMSFAATPDLIVGFVAAGQTGVATGMNTLLRLLGGAVGAQVGATFVADHTAHGLPLVTGFNDSYVMGAALVAIAVLAALCVPRAIAKASRSEAVQTGIVPTEPASDGGGARELAGQETTT